MFQTNCLLRAAPRLQTILLLLIASPLFSRAPAAFAAQSSPRTSQKLEGPPAALKSIVAAGRLDDLRWPDFSDYRSLVADFYAPDYELVWIREGEPTSQASAMIQILREADREGLQAEDYDASRWADRLTLIQSPHDAIAEANFDAALTVCAMRYVSDLRIGRVDPRRMHFEFDISQNKLDLPDFLRERLVNGDDLPAVIAEVEPPFEGYRRLRAALQHYVELAKVPDAAQLPDPGEVTPGHLYSKTPRLADRLRVLGDLPQGVTVPPDSMLYHGELVDAVKHFQERHGIKPTGTVDSRTIAELNVPLADRVEQIRLTLERYRWVPYQFEQPPVVVNVPEFQLYCFDEHGKVTLTMGVNVGDQYNFQTPMFENNIEYVVFRPYWVPPPNILRNEIIPDLEHNPSLKINDLELVSASGQVIRSGNMTPAMMQQLRSGALTARQPPGPENALGLVKMIFPNNYYVYMHDTPADEDKFSPAQRAFSHGCIHVQQPEEFSAWLLRNNADWDLERVRKAMHDGPDNVRVNLALPIPVLIVYQTAVAKENGDVHFFDDIYKHDAELKEELAKGYPYPTGTSPRR